MEATRAQAKRSDEADRTNNRIDPPNRKAMLKTGLVVEWLRGDVKNSALRHPPELTRLCSRKVTRRPACGGDDNALRVRDLQTKAQRPGRVILFERKWISFGERRPFSVPKGPLREVGPLGTEAGYHFGDACAV